MAFYDAFETIFAIKHDLEFTSEKTIQLNMFIDSLSLFDFLTKST